MIFFQIKNSKFLFIALLFLFISCHKQEISLVPNIFVTSPAENSSYMLPGILPVKLSISASQKINYIRLSVITGDQSPVFPTKYFYPGTPSIDLNFNFDMNESVIELTGPYFLQITVDDGQVSNKFIKINLESKPLIYKGFYLSTRTSINEIKVVFIDNYFSAQFFINRSGDYSASDISSEVGKFIILCKNPDKIYAYQFEDGSLSWTHYPDLDFPDISSLCVTNKITFVGKGNGRIVALDNNSGAHVLSTVVMKDSVPVIFGFTDQYFISDMKIRNQKMHALAVFYYSTGSKRHVISHEIEVVDFYQKENKDVLIIIGNRDEKGILTSYDIEGNYFGGLVGICDSPISSSCRIGEADLLFSYNNSVSLINYNNFNIRRLVSLPDSVVSIDYNEISSQLFVATKSTIYLFNYPGLEEIYSFNPGGTIKGIDLRFGY